MAEQAGLAVTRGTTFGLPRRIGAVVVFAMCLTVPAGPVARAQQDPAAPAGQPGADPAAAAAAAAPQDAGAATRASAPATMPTVEDGPAYRVSAFDVQYNLENKSLPKTSEITGRTFALGVIDKRYVVPPSLERKWVQLQLGSVPGGYQARGIEEARVTLDSLNDEAVDEFHASAIWAINEQIKSFLGERGVLGVYVAPDPSDVDLSGSDLRKEKDKTALTLKVYTGVVRDVRTVASGERVSQTARINNPAHARILADSPVKPESTSGKAGSDLLRRDVLDKYVFGLNRHPGRRVDVAVSAFGEEPGAVILDYLVTEAKPWAVYAQV